MKKYELPQIEIIKMKIEDAILQSNFEVGGSTGKTHGDIGEEVNPWAGI